MKTIRPVIPDETLWSRVEPLLAKACHRTGDLESTADIRDRVAGGEYLLVLLENDDRLEGVAVLQNCGDYLHVLSLGGKGIISDISTWLKWWRRIAQHLGFKALSLRGRRGWDKVFEPFGFTRNGNNLEVTLWA